MPNSSEVPNSEFALLRQLLEAKLDALIERMDAIERKLDSTYSKEVMDLKMAALQDQIKAQQTALDTLNTQVLTQWQRVIARAGGMAGLISAAATMFHYLHG